MTPRRAPTSTAEYRATAATSMSEETLLSHVLDAAKKLGWRTTHFRPALLADGSWRTAVQGDGKGWPDLVLVNERMGELLFVELKSTDGELTPEQAAWLCALQNVGQRADVWRPSDWTSGHIQRVLEGVE